MNSTLHVFNPEHDLALANADRNFMAPQSARKLRRDLSVLPLWYAQALDRVLTPAPSAQWLQHAHRLFPSLSDVRCSLDPSSYSGITALQPWGWDSAICRQLQSGGCESGLLPDADQLEEIRRLSHRETAIQAHRYLLQQTSQHNHFSEPASVLYSVEEAEAFAEQHKQVVFKAPWSGSGKGLFWCRTGMTDSHRGWCRNILGKQGNLIAEQTYNIIQDFALEFSCRNGQAFFEGYSLFETDRGIYRSNLLLPNESIEEILLNQLTYPDSLREIFPELLQFITTTIAPHYNGMLGIDMFLYRREDEVWLHPCVEINLRMTMGSVARIFFDRFVHPHSTGHFYVDHLPVAGELWADHRQRQQNQPPVIQDGRMVSGYLSLTEVGPQSHYRIRTEVTSTHQ